MKTRSLPLALAVGAICFGSTATVHAQNPNLALNKKYAYFQTIPGQPPNHYQDDGPTFGPHDVHSLGLGAFDEGNLTDGVLSASASGGPGTGHLAFWIALGTGSAPPVDIIIDLGQVEVVTDVILGTVISAGSNNNAPDDVTVSFSISGMAAANFIGAQFFDLETTYGPLSNGHHDLMCAIGIPTPARYVKFSFDGGSMAEPSGQDPNEKYMLDEIVIHGLGAGCTADSYNFGNGLAGTGGVPTLTASAPPRFSTNINILGGNPTGTATAGLILVGVQQTAFPLLGGVLLVAPLAEASVPVPTGGLTLPVTVPPPPCGVPILVQYLLLDNGAPQGVAFSQALRLDFGT